MNEMGAGVLAMGLALWDIAEGIRGDDDDGPPESSEPPPPSSSK